MKIKQLGNGGGFDFDKTNSSFLIQLDVDNYMLIDCGYNVMAELMKNHKDLIQKIKYVYITHMDDDHIGNLKIFIQYRYFMLHEDTTVFARGRVFDDLTSYMHSDSFDINKELIGSEVVRNNMCILTNLFSKIEGKFDIEIYATNTNHGATQCYGIAIVSKHEFIPNSMIWISGDTKASNVIERHICNIMDEHNIDFNRAILFHDKSNYNVATRSPHACDYDIDCEYSPEFKNNLIYYHTGNDDFKKDWYEL